MLQSPSREAGNYLDFFGVCDLRNMQQKFVQVANLVRLVKVWVYQAHLQGTLEAMWRKNLLQRPAGGAIAQAQAVDREGSLLLHPLSPVAIC